MARELRTQAVGHAAKQLRRFARRARAVTLLEHESADESGVVQARAIQNEKERGQNTQSLDDSLDRTVRDRQKIDQVERKRENHENDDQENKSAHELLYFAFWSARVAIAGGVIRLVQRTKPTAYAVNLPSRHGVRIRPP